MINAFLKGYLILWFGIFLSTEILSAFHCFNRLSVQIYWVVFLIISAFFARRSRFAFFRGIGFSGVLFLIIIGLTFCCGISYPPDNWDSMVYHLGRIPMWIQNEGVQLYETPIFRQNYQMPLAEYGIAHLSLLTGSDRMAFLIQWTSLIAASLGCAKITRLLGGSRKAMERTLLFCAVIPMALLQASSTQNDLAVGSFLVIFAGYLLEFTPGKIVWTALAFGLALMTKGTAYVYTGVLGIGLGVLKLMMTERPKRKKTAAALCAAALSGIVLSAGFYCRCTKFYGSPIYSPPSDNYIAETSSPALLATNILKHAALHFSVSDRMSNLTRETYRRLFKELDHPAITFRNVSFHIFSQYPHEDTVGNFFHLLLYLASIVMLVFFRENRDSLPRKYAGTIIAAAVVFCAVITWSPWQSRLHTSLFLLFAPIPAIVFDRLEEKHVRRIFLSYFELVFFFFAVLILYFSELRPLGKIFTGYDPLPPDRRSAVNAVCRELRENGVTHAGILCGDDHKVYYLFREMNIHARRDPHFRMDFDGNAPWLICERKFRPAEIRNYQLISVHPPYRLFKRKDASPLKTGAGIPEKDEAIPKVMQNK